MTASSAKTSSGFFRAPLRDVDAAVASALAREQVRQRSQIELIAPKNYMSRAARDALGSLIAFTSVEGYPGERWHAGTVNLDEIEALAVARAQELFGSRYANVQPHSGTQANQAAFFALLEPGDRVVSMSLADGGHLSHGDPTTCPGAGSTSPTTASARTPARSTTTSWPRSAAATGRAS